MEKKPKSRVIRYKGNGWRGVKPSVYKSARLEAHWAAIGRHVLMDGSKGERALFHVRYFEIEPGGYSSFETHGHEHFVVVVKGRGTVRLGKKVSELGFLDSVYVCPGEPHQFNNPFGGAFGFLCLVDARRDSPAVIGVGKPVCELPRKMERKRRSGAK